MENGTANEGMLLRDYIEANFVTDNGWIGKDKLHHIDAAYIRHNAYLPFSFSKRLWNKLTGRVWALPLSTVFRDVRFVWIDEDIVGVVSDWHFNGFIRSSHPLRATGQLSLLAASDAFDCWLELDADYGDWSLASTFRIRTHGYYLDLPIFTYIDHVRVK